MNRDTMIGVIGCLEDEKFKADFFRLCHRRLIWDILKVGLITAVVSIAIHGTIWWYKHGGF